MTREKRRIRGFLTALVSDPYRKLAAVALAVGLWFFLNTRVQREIALSIPLATIGSQSPSDAVFLRRLAVVLPTDRIVPRGFRDGEQAIDSVTIVLRGENYLIDQLEGETLDLRITRFLGQEWSNRTSLEFTVADIQRNLRALQDVHLEMRPANVRLDVDRMEYRDLRLTSEQVELVVDEALGQRLRRETAEFSTETVRVVGPASSLASLPAQKPLLARIRSVTNERQVASPLELNAPRDLGLRLAEPATITMQITPVTRLFELEMPILVDDWNLSPELRGLYQPERRTQVVRFRAGGALRAHLLSLTDENKRDWALAHLRLEVWIPKLEASATYGPEIPREARLRLRGPLQSSVDPTEFALADTVLITLRRTP